MSQYGVWNPYSGSASIILAIVLLMITGVLIFGAIRLQHAIAVKMPGPLPGIFIVAIWLLSVMTFLVASTLYARTLYEQVGPFTAPVNPITPLTETLALVSFIAIAYLTRRNGFWIAFGSAIAGTIAAPMIFELPFDLIVMWRTYPPTPTTLFTLLFFFPLFLVELSSFALLLCSPPMRFSRYTLFFLAAMFLLFAIWALFGFAYPETPIPTALNMLSKLMAFATAVSLFIPWEKIA